MDETFPKSLTTPISVAELVRRIDDGAAQTIGDEEQIISSIAALDDGIPGSLVFCKSLRAGIVKEMLETTEANVIIVGVDLPPVTGRCYIEVDDPMRWMIQALRTLFPEQARRGIHPTAQIGDDVDVGEDVEIGPNVTIGDDIQIGEGSQIYAGTYIGNGTIIGQRCVIGPNCSIGGHGLGVSQNATDAPLHFPHLGRVMIGDDVRVGANCAVMRGTLKDTVIGDWTQIGGMVNIAHNCKIGKNCWISAQTMLCGSVKLEADAMIGAGASINNHVTIGTGATVGLGSIVTKNVKPGDRVFGCPARPLKTMRPLT